MIRLYRKTADEGACTARGAMFDLQGHRGARGLWPENTLPGFRAAIELGVTSIELDVVLSADNVPMVYHDLTLNPDLTRTPEGGWITAPGAPVATLSAADLARFDVGRIRPRGRYAARCRGQTPIDGAHIPTLRDVCALGASSAIRLDIEIKSDRKNPSSGPSPATLARVVMDAVEATEMLGRVAVRSFDWQVLRAMRQAYPAIPLAWLTGVGASANAAAVRAAVLLDGLPDWPPVWAPDHRLLRRRHVRAAQSAGLSVKPWTVNAAFRMRQLIRWGVDGFCTDRPDIGRVVLAQL
jgi:glycerophosphoryl diester phosphodiesterase